LTNIIKPTIPTSSKDNKTIIGEDHTFISEDDITEEFENGFNDITAEYNIPSESVGKENIDK
jgi:hypothetical protein